MTARSNSTAPRTVISNGSNGSLRRPVGKPLIAATNRQSASTRNPSEGRSAIRRSEASDQTPSGSPRLIVPSELWSPRVIAEVDDSYIKVAKVQGVFGWHKHADEDELFLILKGTLRIEMDDGAVELGEGEIFVVPKGVRHNPAAEHECLVMLIERKTTARG